MGVCDTVTDGWKGWKCSSCFPPPPLQPSGKYNWLFGQCKDKEKKASRPLPTFHLSLYLAFLELSIFKAEFIFFDIKTPFFLLSPVWLLILPCTQLAKLDISDAWDSLFTLTPHGEQLALLTPHSMAASPAWLHGRGESLRARRSNTALVEGVAAGLLQLQHCSRNKGSG